HDYDQFLELAQRDHQRFPRDRTKAFQVASAYACKYADTGEDHFKQSALEQLASMGEDQSSEETEYRQRIMHRIETRRIMAHKQFHKEFPNGWKPAE
ncbi:MAG TPA: hypothetical protein VGJ16_10020, partial [Pirellulales bacterium]